MKTLFTIVFTVLVALAIGLGFVYSGAVGVGADQPESSLLSSLLITARERAVERGARDVAVPGNLADAKLIASGAGEYAEMCTGCHLAPGMEESEMRAGLNPQPPELSKAAALPPARQFWIIKHGIRMTGMPAWGPTHDDEIVWSMVAFLQKLPGMSAGDYHALVEAGGEHHHHDDDHAAEHDGEAAPTH